MPKGEAPRSAQSLSVEEVANKLAVKPNQVHQWLKDNVLKGDASKGIRPYDFKKFQFDHRDEIQKAQTRALQDTQQTTSRKPSKKGLFSKLKSYIFTDKDDPAGPSDPQALLSENQKLKSELNKLKRVKPERRAEGEDLEEKVRFLEKRISETRELEAEVIALRRQISEGPQSGVDISPEEFESLLQQVRDAEEQSQQNEELRRALQQQEEEHRTLLQELSQAKSSETLEQELQDTRTQILEREQQLEALRLREQQWESLNREHEGTIEELRRELLQAAFEQDRLRQEIQTVEKDSFPVKASATSEKSQEGQVDSSLLDELIELQERNLVRYQLLSRKLQLAEERLAEPHSRGSKADQTPPPDSSEQSSREVEALRRDLELLDATVQRLTEENENLKVRLEGADSEPLKSKIRDLEKQLEKNQRNESGIDVLESELKSLRKSLQTRENQVQKMAGRLQENERALDKAMKESARLTELLIEREGRLRDLAAEYEQEYRGKIDNLDRQVSGLQWKLSLREERIAQLESEVLKNSPR